jgi:hypothetical protein
MPFALMLTILCNACGFYVFFNQAQNMIRREIRGRIRDGLNESDLVNLEINDENRQEFHWIKPGKEFSFHGNLFDVVKTEKVDGKSILCCINDIKEKKLISDFARTHEASHKAIKFLVMIINSYIDRAGICLHIPVFSAIRFYSNTFNIISKLSEIADPPPKSTVLV